MRFIGVVKGLQGRAAGTERPGLECPHCRISTSDVAGSGGCVLVMLLALGLSDAGLGPGGKAANGVDILDGGEMDWGVRNADPAERTDWGFSSEVK